MSIFSKFSTLAIMAGAALAGDGNLISPEENTNSFVSHDPYSNKFFKHKRNRERMARHSRQVNRR